MVRPETRYGGETHERLMGRIAHETSMAHFRNVQGIDLTSQVAILFYGTVDTVPVGPRRSIRASVDRSYLYTGCRKYRVIPNDSVIRGCPSHTSLR